MIVKPKKGMTVDDLTNLIDEYDGLSDAVYGTDVYDDLSRVGFDLENLERFGTEDSYTHLPGLSDMEGYEILADELERFHPEGGIFLAAIPEIRDIYSVPSAFAAFTERILEGSDR